MSGVFEAVRSGESSKLAEALAAGVDLDVMDEQSGESALAIAAGRGDVVAVKMLLEAGADPNHLETISWPLTNAARYGHADVVELLLDYDAETDSVDDTGETALHTAAAQGHEKIVEQLIEAGANPRQRDETGQRAIHRAADNGHWKIVDLLSPLSTAKDRKEVELMRQLAAQGPTSDAVRDYITAAKNGDVESIKRIIANGMKVDAIDEFGTTAAERAAAFGQLHVLEYLVNQGSDVNRVDIHGICPLIAAAYGCQETTYDFLFTLTKKSHQKTAEIIKNMKVRSGMWPAESSG